MLGHTDTAFCIHWVFGLQLGLWYSNVELYVVFRALLGRSVLNCLPD
jgi:hypothetical protein